jgi:hypothetical protein
MNLTGISDVDELICEIRDGLRESLGEQLFGFYVFGSIATDGYEHGSGSTPICSPHPRPT